MRRGRPKHLFQSESCGKEIWNLEDWVAEASMHQSSIAAMEADFQCPHLRKS